MEIYFDGTLINTDYYTQFSMSSKMFNENESFTLGKTLCNSITLGIDKRYAPLNPTDVLVKINNADYMKMVVDNQIENDFEIVYKLTDKMINLNFNYDASEIFEDGSTTLLEILQDICLKGNLSLATTSFIGADKVISWYDNTITAREYVGYIAELNGGYAFINKDGELELKRFNNMPEKTINLDECSDYEIGDYHRITKVVYDNGVAYYENGVDNYNTLYINPNNVFIESQEDIDNIYDVVQDLEFYSFKTTNCPIYSDVYTGDCIEFTDGTNDYLTFAQSEPNFYGNFTGGYKFVVNSEKQESTTEISGTENNYKRLKILQDRANASLKILAEEKVGEDEIIAKLNIAVQDGQGVIELSGNTVTIDSDNFKLTADGTMQCENANIVGGTINITSTDAVPKLIVKQNDTDYTEYRGKSIRMYENGNLILQINSLGIGGIILYDSQWGYQTQLTALGIKTPNIQKGTVELNSSSWVHINFEEEMNGIPSVVITPYTTATGTIAGKVRNITTTGFDAVIGGSVSGNIEFNWIAIS